MRYTSLSLLASFLICLSANAHALSPKKAAKKNQSHLSQVASKSTNSDILKDLVAEGNFGHIGGKPSLDFILGKLKNKSFIKHGNSLELGSGYGGNANYLFAQGFKKIWSLDANKNAIDYASAKYPNVKFTHLDNLDVNKEFGKNFFSFVYMINFIDTVGDKEALLNNLSKVATKGAILVICDYSKTNRLQNPQEPVLRDFAGNAIYPIEPASFAASMRTLGWKVIETSDITENYISWYNESLAQFSSKRKGLIKSYNSVEVENIENGFNRMLFNMHNHNIGGILIIAQKL